MLRKKAIQSIALLVANLDGSVVGTSGLDPGLGKSIASLGVIHVDKGEEEPESEDRLGQDVVDAIR